MIDAQTDRQVRRQININRWIYDRQKIERLMYGYTDRGTEGVTKIGG